MENWPALLAIAAIAVSIFSAMGRFSEKALSVREHEEFRNSIRDQFLAVRDQERRDVDRVESRLNQLEQTRPTTGELEARLETLNAKK